MDWTKIVPQCFDKDTVYFTSHAKREMASEEFGVISISEVVEAAKSVKLLEEYPEDTPYPSALLLGFTLTERPIHLVCAFDEDGSLLIVITIYHPDPERWIKNMERKMK